MQLKNFKEGRGKSKSDGKVLYDGDPSSLALWSRLLDNFKKELGKATELSQQSGKIHDRATYKEKW